ncbi:MAG: 50S ribosomal protein L21 [Patescibacteria group bacterium]
MARLAVVQSGGKQYLVQSDQEIVVQNIPQEEKSVDLQVLAIFDDEKGALELGEPMLKSVLKAEVLENVKGEKVRVAKFKSKVRYRKVRGFRPQLTRIKIGTI